MGGCTTKEAIDFASIVADGVLEGNRERYLLNLLAMLRRKSKLTKQERLLLKQLVDKELANFLTDDITDATEKEDS